MKKFFKKLNIAHSPLLRIICVLCAVATCVFPFAVSASAAEHNVISIWDLPFTTTVNGNTNTVKVDFPLDKFEDCSVVVFGNGNYVTDYGGTFVSFGIESNTEYRVQFYNLLSGVPLDAKDFPSNTVVTISTLIDGTSVDSWVESPGFEVTAGYYIRRESGTTLSGETLCDPVDGQYIDKLVSADIPLNFPANAYGVLFEPSVLFRTKSYVAPNNGVNFNLTSFSVQFSVTDLWVQATQNNKLNGVLDDVKTELKNQGTTLNQVLKEQGITNDKLDDVLGEQEETNDKLDNIINGTVDSTLPPDSGVVDDFHEQEEEIMGSVNEGFDTALGVLEDTLISIMEVLAGFHAIAYIFNLFYSLPLIQLVVNFSLVMGLFGAMLGIANMVGNKFIGKVGGKGKD